MSADRPGSGTPGDELSSEQVARLLASAGGAEPTPPDVATRLDAALADLVAERGVTAPVVTLPERRARRTWAPRLLVAAGVLGVAGIGFSVADDLTGGVTSNESATAGDAAGSSATEAMRLPQVLRITDTASLRTAVRAAARPAADSLASRSAPEAASVACAVPRGPGRSTLVSYEGSLATLVVRRDGDRLDGRVYDCDLGLQVDGVEIGPAQE